MKKLYLFILAVLLIAGAGAMDLYAQSEVTGAIQAGVGAASTNGTVEFGLNYQVVTLDAAGMVFPNQWLAVIADISYGLPHEYNYQSGSDQSSIKTKAGFADGMLGVHKPFADGGFVYVATGLTIGWGSIEVEDPPDPTDELDMDTALGVVFGAGMALPIADNFMGTLTLRQRYLTGELGLDTDGSRTIDFGIGGLNVGVGLAYFFGK